MGFWGFFCLNLGRPNCPFTNGFRRHCSLLFPFPDLHTLRIYCAKSIQFHIAQECRFRVLMKKVLFFNWFSLDLQASFYVASLVKLFIGNLIIKVKILYLYKLGLIKLVFCAVFVFITFEFQFKSFACLIIFIFFPSFSFFFSFFPFLIYHSFCIMKVVSFLFRLYKTVCHVQFVYIKLQISPLNGRIYTCEM